VCHLLLGRSWKFVRDGVHDGKKNTFKFQKDGVNHTLFPLQKEGNSESSDPKSLLMCRKEFLQQLKIEEVNFFIIFKPRVVLTSTTIFYFPLEIQELLVEHHDIVVDDLPSELQPTRSINHHIDLILGTSLPHKNAYFITPKENEEVKKQVQELLEKG